MQVPVIDIARFASSDPKDRLRVAREWDETFRSIGFAVITGHGIDEALLDDVYDVGRAFFEQPLKAKLAVHGKEGGRGYEGIGEASVARTRGETIPHDLVEAIGFRSILWEKEDESRGLPVNKHPWPQTPANFRPVVERYIDAGFKLGHTLMRLSAIALNLPETHFDPYYERMSHNLRLAYYPDQVEPPLEGQLRNGPHTDFTGFTILRQDGAPGGLQVVGPHGEWVDVKPIPGTLVINSGDLMQRWTNDRWRSNIHRVVNPDRSLTGSTARLSIVLFTGPSPDAEIGCLPTCMSQKEPARYPPILTRDHFALRMKQTYG